jgi:hypothetical protein
MNEPLGREGLPNPSAKLQSMERECRTIANILGEHCGANWGFLLSFFDFAGPEMTWISNAEREGAIKMIEELATRLKEGKAGTLTEPDPDLRKRRLAEMLKLCTDEERHELFGAWCQGCGGTLPCTCMRDE